MATIDESIRVLDLKPDVAQSAHYEFIVRLSKSAVELYNQFSLPAREGIERPVQSRDLATERLAPIVLYSRDESGKFVSNGTIKLSEINRITVYADQAVRDESADAVKEVSSSSSVVSISRASVEAELRAGGYKSVGYIQFIKYLMCDRITTKEFVPVRFQRYPNGPVEEAYIRGSRVLSLQYFTNSEERDQTDPDYPSSSFNDPRLLERTTIRVRPLPHANRTALGDE